MIVSHNVVMMASKIRDNMPLKTSGGEQWDGSVWASQRHTLGHIVENGVLIQTGLSQQGFFDTTVFLILPVLFCH